jgi:UDP-N-acetylglucosamine--N-acetylmuramyl-(pentapeptide) pyrophosphoryl-undecaprenol N-acetylglucosamine transferase
VLEEIHELLSSYRIILQTGNNLTYKDYEKALEIKSNLSDEKQQMFLPVKYIDDKSIGYVYHNMDLLLGRAGANTVYEMGVLAKPSIFIPIPWVTNNEQFENAKSLRDLGLSEIIDEKDFKDIDLKKKIDIEAKRLPTEKFNKDLLQNKFPTNAVEKVLNDMYT